jgi:hypothetical protein
MDQRDIDRHDRYGSFAILPRPFIVKLIAVVLLTIIGATSTSLCAGAKGDAAAAARIRSSAGLPGAGDHRHHLCVITFG